MFRHVLVPVDGSALSAKAVRSAVRLAKALGARVTGLHVAYAYLSAEYMPTVAPRKLKRLVAREAGKALAPLLKQSARARVACGTRTVVTGEPWRAILRTARSRGCDVIVMASHGRAALASLVLGSETAQVLAHSKIPVLVVR